MLPHQSSYRNVLSLQLAKTNIRIFRRQRNSLPKQSISSFTLDSAIACVECLSLQGDGCAGPGAVTTAPKAKLPTNTASAFKTYAHRDIQYPSIYE